jgi:hypothetical protein
MRKIYEIEQDIVVGGGKVSAVITWVNAFPSLPCSQLSNLQL